MSSDESTILQFASYKPFVRRPHGSSPADSRYLQPTVKHPPSVMVWGCFSSQSRGGLYFLPKGQTMNASRNISVLDDHLHVLNFMSIHGCTTFQKWMHNFPKRLGTVPQSQISHELVSHQKCHNAQMGRKFS